MRLLHTADWHLGRIFHGQHLTSDQAHVLSQFADLARDTQPDAIVIAGDVFDRAVPPPEAVELLDDVLARLAAETDAHIIIIAGNHDSPARLGFGAALLARAQVHVYTQFASDPAPLVLADAHGPVHLHPLPYVEPVLARSDTGNDDLRTHEDVFRLLLGNIRQRLRQAGNPRAIIAAHATVLGGEASESERPLAIGGAEAISPALFEGFAYTALGHLHRPQDILVQDSPSTSRVRYAGSLLKYSYSEVDHRKSVSLVEIDARGHACVEEIALVPRHDVRRISGLLDELLAAAEHDPAPDDYLLAEITDTSPLPDAMERLRTCYPNLLQIRRPWLERAVHGVAEAAEIEQLRAAPLDMCVAFVRDMTGNPPDEATRQLLADVVEEVLRMQREARS